MSFLKLVQEGRRQKAEDRREVCFYSKLFYLFALMGYFRRAALALLLTASALFLGCTSQPLQIKSAPTPTQSANIPSANTSLKEAVKELRILEDKIKSGIDVAGYAVIITKTSPLVQNAFGDAKAVAAVKSAFKGHQLAVKFWECDRIEGYDALHQCRGKALSEIFSKYPDIATQAKAAVKSNDLPTISAQLSKESILQAIWNKTSTETQAASQAISTETTPQKSQP